MNIKGFASFEMDFSRVSKPGWHVLIGDNGSGKTTVLRCIGMALLEDEFPAVFARNEFRNERWMKQSCNEWKLILDASKHELDTAEHEAYSAEIHYQESNNQTSEHWNLDHKDGDDGDFRFGFASGYGPYRMLEGRQDYGLARFSFFDTLYIEEQGLSERVGDWLKGLKLDSSPESQDTLQFVVDFINRSHLLPNGVTLTNTFGSEGIKFKDAAGAELYIQDAAAGYRSMLTLVIDLVKNMILHFEFNGVRENYTLNEATNIPQFNLSGVVLIDEVDSHLHPTWQTRIGDVFTDCFPKVQFIVTTHSPLICRGAVNGTIWRLAALGSEQTTGLVPDLERKRLIYGDILDA